VQLLPDPPPCALPGFGWLATRERLTKGVRGPAPRSFQRRGAIAQLGERLVCNQKVAGSIPAGSTTLRLGGLLVAGHPKKGG
jgi:uncharacterized Zn-binding protein involved in type VI secretion